MTFEWYDPKTKNGEDAKISGTTITFTETGLTRLNQVNPSFETAGYVVLGWDSQRSLVGLAPASENISGAFKFGLRGRSKLTRTISAARFFDAYRIPAIEGKELAAIQVIDGVAAIPLHSAQSKIGSTSDSDELPKRRGRKPKSSVV
jgi:hypothetical protein